MLSNNFVLYHHFDEFVFAHLSGVKRIICLPPLLCALNTLSDFFIGVLKMDGFTFLFEQFLNELFDQVLEGFGQVVMMLDYEFGCFSIVVSVSLLDLVQIQCCFGLRKRKKACFR